MPRPQSAVRGSFAGWSVGNGGASSTRRAGARSESLSPSDRPPIEWSERNICSGLVAGRAGARPTQLARVAKARAGMKISGAGGWYPSDEWGRTVLQWCRHASITIFASLSV